MRRKILLAGEWTKALAIAQGKELIVRDSLT